MNALRQCRFLNTRAVHQAAALTKKLEAHGGIVIEHPLIAIDMPADFSPVRQALHLLEHYQWLIFTSVNSIRFFFQLLKDEGVDLTLLENMKFAAVGGQTAAALEKKGYRAAVVPKAFAAEHLADELVNVIKSGERVLFPRSSLARNVVVAGLERVGIEVDAPVIYETVYDVSGAERLNRLLKAGTLDVILFTSPSAVHSFFQQVSASVWENSRHSLRVAVIGAITARALTDYRVDDVIVAEQHTLDGLIDTLISEREMLRVASEFKRGRNNDSE
ncbi:uroporphyrinogen-III synthase/uroporphyrinogen III methyltransferase / synthase [Evansella caseinilytica]|uniref:Uroporphyrinogen-III synthase n=1 Tax=Evansella caseinilytica TaxID=1503961 RepID=A0A1H3PVG3_9BACI|nr:uroporphyrinogen-III synthase [Evansella caseinilytica]SDZ04953.1 uroporphyrinogen-III synthase/uroporphyrinogen III methyltransferase / synthase [Evansella caseinilytica]